MPSIFEPVVAEDLDPEPVPLVVLEPGADPEPGVSSSSKATTDVIFDLHQV